MSLYEILLFAHIVFAILWVGAGFALVVLGLLGEWKDDEGSMRTALDGANRLGNVYFVPVSLLVLVFGIALVAESEAWSFGQLWIVLGLVGYALTFFTGLLVIKPRGEKIGRMVEDARGAMTPEAMLEGRKLLTLARIDYIVLFLVVLDMVVKPTGDDAGLLVAMAAILVLGVGYTVWRARALGPAGPARQAA
jgi:uncharacterized membrane protein